jgi:hypothetical protein
VLLVVHPVRELKLAQWHRVLGDDTGKIGCSAPPLVDGQQSAIAEGKVIAIRYYLTGVAGDDACIGVDRRRRKSAQTRRAGRSHAPGDSDEWQR